MSIDEIIVVTMHDCVTVVSSTENTYTHENISDRSPAQTGKIDANSMHLHHHAPCCTQHSAVRHRRFAIKAAYILTNLHSALKSVPHLKVLSASL